MVDSSQHDYTNTELDPDRLSAPFGTQTNWQVITGAASCGKTSLIELLADQGFRTVPETARLYIESEMARGRTVPEMRQAGAAFQRRLIHMQLQVESGLRPTDVVFLDRAVPDYLAYCRSFGPDPNEFLAGCFRHRYACVFWLDPLPFHHDGARDQDAGIVDHLGEWHACDYRALGYSAVRLPVLPPEERLAIVLERLAEQGLI